jgi:hypothetical protein
MQVDPVPDGNAGDFLPERAQAEPRYEEPRAERLPVITATVIVTVPAIIGAPPRFEVHVMVGGNPALAAMAATLAAQKLQVIANDLLIQANVAMAARSKVRLQ